VHWGPCVDDLEVGGVRHSSRNRINWTTSPGVLTNIYKKVVHDLAITDFGDCLYAGLYHSCNGVALPGTPPPGELWLFQITTVFLDGEGPMGTTGACTVREPTAPCTCTLPADRGPCGGNLARWFHNLVTERCESFSWSGCGGNANRFATREACEATCTATCILPPQATECCAALLRWFYSQDTGRCEIFIDGGCAGNANEFLTQQECEAACGGSAP